MTVRVIKFVVVKTNYGGKKCIKIRDKVFSLLHCAHPLYIPN
jgi:hypothetical protein